jgi:integrase/recombinase XerD
MSEAISDAILLADAERVLQYHLDLIGGGRQQRRKKAIQQFLSGLHESSSGDAERLIFDEACLLRWMIRDVAGRSLIDARRRLGAISRFVQSLTCAGLLHADPIAQFRSAFRDRGWIHLVPALQAPDPEAALAVLRSQPARPSPLAIHLQSYLDFQRALGKKYDDDRRTLTDLQWFFQARSVPSIEAITPTMIESWFESLPGNWRTRHGKTRCISRFFAHLVGTRVMEVNPVPRPLLATRRGVPRSRPPFIFTTQQLTAILDEFRQLPTDGFAPWHTQTCHTMLLLLYALGLRHGEARRLRIRDVDFSRQTLFIDRTKFYKSRCLPFGPKVGRSLQEFLDLRRTILPPVREEHPLFVAWWRTPVCPSMLGDTFRTVVRKLGITANHARSPRLHDLRHTFAVHRLLRWYRERVDVQARLPWLATFLGHVDIQATEVYLTITAELLREANSRFYEHFGRGLESGNPGTPRLCLAAVHV